MGCPNLESLLELPLSAEENKPLDLKVIRRPAQQAFQGRGYYDEWVDTADIERNLNPLLKLAEGYLSRNDAENSALIYETILAVSLQLSVVKKPTLEPNRA